MSKPYPERAAGGFTRVDGNVEFYGRVQALLAELPDGATVVDFGAGRGMFAEDPVVYRRDLHDLRGPGRTVIGCDIDPVVKTNPMVDEGRLIHDGVIPVDDASVSMVVSDFTWEHVDDAGAAAAELDRVLVPGGWICARTPNKWGYIAIGARIVPNRLHVAALRRLQPHKHEQDTFPTRYRLNTRRAIEQHFPSPRFDVYAYTADFEHDLYSGRSRLLGAALRLIQLAPAPFKGTWLIYIRKAG